LPGPPPAVPAPAGSAGTSAPGPDAGSATLPADPTDAVLGAAGTRSAAARDAVGDVAADPSFSPD
ncbi:hypothetical protein, partial [Geodermatophilus sp. CPCC 205506]|uniref:hypothetical protein n=1 Tax=Geodermatophilus sp. CPCC 205506 TaxID=2936596 RepID=UPI003EEF8C1B